MHLPRLNALRLANILTVRLAFSLGAFSSFALLKLPKFGFIFRYVRNRVRVAARPRPKPYSKQEPHFVSRDKVHLVRLMSRDRGESG